MTAPLAAEPLDGIDEEVVTASRRIAHQTSLQSECVSKDVGGQRLGGWQRRTQLAIGDDGDRIEVARGEVQIVDRSDDGHVQVAQDSQQFVLMA